MGAFVHLGHLYYGAFVLGGLLSTGGFCSVTGRERVAEASLALCKRVYHDNLAVARHRHG